MKSTLVLMLLVFGLLFHPAFLLAADDAAPKAADAAVAAETSVEGGADIDAGGNLGDWELGKDDLAAEDEDLKLDEEEDAKTDVVAPDAVKPV